MGKLFTALGLMSGTSGDGIDTSIIISDGIDHYSEIRNEYFKYDQKIYENLHNLKSKIFKLNDLKKNENEINLLEKEITLFHAKIVNKILKSIDFTNLRIDQIFFEKKHFDGYMEQGKKFEEISKKLIKNNYKLSNVDDENILAEKI